MTRFATVRQFEIVDSTNRLARDAARDGAGEELVIVADEQSEGRGRRGRSWIAPKGSALLCSMIFRPDFDLGNFHVVVSAVALAVRDAVIRLTGSTVDLKWPNDVVHAEKKLAGILGEVVTTDRLTNDHRSNSQALVVGLGLNLSWPDGWPPSDDDELTTAVAQATTLQQVSGVRVGRDEMLQGLLQALDERYGVLVRDGGFARTMDAYRSACTTIGRTVQVTLDTETFEAKAVDIQDDGRLVLERGDQRVVLEMGDVVHLRSR